MSTYKEMVHQAEVRRADLVSEIEAARRRIAVCEGEIDVLDQVVSALSSVSGAPAPARKAAAAAAPAAPAAEDALAAKPARKTRRKGGRRKSAATKKPFSKWRPGGPGRPPKSYVDAQKAAAAAAGAEAPAAKPAAKKRRKSTRRKAAK